MSFKRFILDKIPFHYQKNKFATRLLCYHSLAVGPFSLSSSSLAANDFRDHCNVLAKLPLVSIDEMLNCKSNNSICLTFDDGDISFFKALEILQEYKLPVTLFVSVSFLRSSSKSYLSPQDLISISQYPFASIQSHGTLHVQSSQLSTDQLIDDLWYSKSFIEDILGLPVHHFAAPYGKPDPRFQVVCPSLGFRTCFLGGSRPYSSTQSRFSIPRYGILPSTNKRSLLNLLNGKYDFF